MSAYSYEAKLCALLDTYGRTFHQAKEANGQDGTEGRANAARKALVEFFHSHSGPLRETAADLYPGMAKPVPERLHHQVYNGTYKAGWNDYIDAVNRVGERAEGDGSADYVKGWNACHAAHHATRNTLTQKP